MLAQCDKEPALKAKIALEKYTYHQPIMGTRFSIVLFADNKEKADTAARAAFKYAEEVNRTCSDYDGTSELMQLNAAFTNKPFSCSPMLFLRSDGMALTGVLHAKKTLFQPMRV